MIIGIRVVGGILIQCLQSLKSNIDKVSAIILEMVGSCAHSIRIYSFISNFKFIAKS